jgi:hypothetical protein
MNSVSTQTNNTKEISTQVNNVNFIIEDLNQYSSVTNPINIYSNSFDCVYNKIMKVYHKKINERGHCILNWRDYDKIHSKIAIETIQELQNANINPPFWLISRANKNNRIKL